MSPLTVLLLVLILAVGLEDADADADAGREPANGLPGSGNRRAPLRERVDRVDRVDRVALEATGSGKEASAARRTRLRQDLQRLMSAMVRKIIAERRYGRAGGPASGRSGEGARRRVEASGENKVATGGEPEGNGLEAGERAEGRGRAGGRGGRSGRKIGEEPSTELSRVSEGPTPLGRRAGRGRGEPEERASGRRSRRGTRRRTRRSGERDAWMKRGFEDNERTMKMHAFVVRDEDVPPCCSTAEEVTDRRYFMCSGAVLTLGHAITTASCIHYADVYEHHVEGDLAILVGATTPRAYVIKVDRYEMHPDYDYDVDSRNHAANDAAILYLACSIVEQDAVVPSLPKGLNDDVAHMCCREACDIVTVVQSFDNRHTARILPARHLPAPRHDEDAPNYRHQSNAPFDSSERFNGRPFANDTPPSSRRIRSPLRLAAAPIFFGGETRGPSRPRSSAKPVVATEAKTRKKAKTSRAKTSRAKNRQRERKRKKPLGLDDPAAGRRPAAAQIPILRALEEEGVSVEEQLAAVDWEKIEETMSSKLTDANREKIGMFAKSVVDETMRRLETVLDDGVVIGGGGGGSDGGSGGGNGNGFSTKGSASSVFEKLMPTGNRNRSIDSFVKVFTKVVTSLLPPNSAATLTVSSDSSVEEKDLQDPPPLHEECPPLGSPIFVGDVLVGLLGYTCDDAQTWVEWKYVNIAKNMNWIRERISKVYEPPGTCAGAERSPPRERSVPNGTKKFSVGEKKLFDDNSTEIRRAGRVEWPSGERTRGGNGRSDTAGRAPPAAAEASAGTPKDRWFARNSGLAPGRRSSDDALVAASRDRHEASIVDAPVYTVNTCYVKPDGTTDCLSRTDVDIRRGDTSIDR